jgi:hypothetical protein
MPLEGIQMMAWSCRNGLFGHIPDSRVRQDTFQIDMNERPHLVSMMIAEYHTEYDRFDRLDDLLAWLGGSERRRSGFSRRQKV